MHMYRRLDILDYVWSVGLICFNVPLAQKRKRLTFKD